MEDEKLWTIYFAQVAGIRMHPANDKNSVVKDQLRNAAACANYMLELHKERWPCHSDQPPSSG